MTGQRAADLLAHQVAEDQPMTTHREYRMLDPDRERCVEKARDQARLDGWHVAAVVAVKQAAGAWTVTLAVRPQ